MHFTFQNTQITVNVNITEMKAVPLPQTVKSHQWYS